MENNRVKSYLGGLGVYAVCLLPAILPIFRPALGLAATGYLVAASIVASMLVAIEMLTGFDEKIGDPEAKLTQALLGMVICAGLYAWLAPLSQPQITLMSLLWVGVGLTRLTPWGVLVLELSYLCIYLGSYTVSLIDGGDARHGDALDVLLVSLMLAVFMYTRSRAYERGRQEKVELRDENAEQARELAKARAQIHAVTIQDMDTIALKYPYFKDELQRCKDHADETSTTFSIGLMQIDHFQALSARHGETVMKQLMRECVERATGVISQMGLEDDNDGGFHPLGRVGDGLFGIILPRANLKGAVACAQQLHHAIESQAIRTMGGPVSVTLTIGVSEYFPGGSVDDLMTVVGRSLEKARLRDLQDQQPARHPHATRPYVKAANGADDLRLLHDLEYDRPVH